MAAAPPPRSARQGLLLGTGRVPAESLGVRDVLAGHAAAGGAPAALGATLLVAGLLALLPSAARVLTLACWVVAAVAAVVLAGLARVSIPTTGGQTWPAVGAFVVVVLAAMVTAVVLAEPELWRGRLAPARRFARPAVAVALAAVPIVGLGWFAQGGHDVLDRTLATEVPAYMEQRLGARSRARGAAHRRHGRVGRHLRRPARRRHHPGRGRGRGADPRERRADP
ncbi:MAG: hypothetical protein R2734_21005 [Nocardioides sp.]